MVKNRKQSKKERNKIRPGQGKTLSRLYYSLTHPAAYGGVQKLVKHSKLPAHIVKNWLKGESTYTLHKTPRRNFLRVPILVSAKDEQWQGDLTDLSSLAQFNEGFRYLLCLVDCFSRYAFVKPIENKSGACVSQALAHIMKDRSPEKLYTDNGKEFLNYRVKDFLKQKGCLLVTTENTEIKASIVERFQRTLKTKLWRYFTKKRTQRYIDVLPALVRAYNHSTHSSINMAPVEVQTPEDELIAFLYMERQRKKKYGQKKAQSSPSFKIGEVVRITSPFNILSKGYAPRYSRESFIVARIHKPNPRKYQTMYLYTLKDKQGEILSGRFYPQEIQSIRESSREVFPIKRILQTRVIPPRKKEVLVRWEGFPKSFDSWIPETSLLRLG